MIDKWAELREAEEKATKGPWTAERHNDYTAKVSVETKTECIANCDDMLGDKEQDANNAAFIALSREAVPTLLAENKRMREALERLVAAVGNMKVPQTVEEAAIQITLTLGPAFENARNALKEQQP